MDYIAHLDLAVNNSLKGLRWRALANEIGTPVRDYDGPVGALDRIGEFIRNAKGLILPYENFLLSPELVNTVRACVADGIPLFVRIDGSSLEKLNPFLIEYGLEGTTLAIHGETGVESRLVELSRRESPSAFYPHPLLENVGDLTIEMPNAIRYAGNTIPLLTLPWERFSIVDSSTDRLVEWTSPELTCLALSPVGDTGGVLAISCRLTHDGFTGPTGIEWPGISAADNEMLAANILKWLARDPLQYRSVAARAFDLVDVIERSLFDVVASRLKIGFGDWWTEGVPLKIRQKCAERAEEEGNKVVKEAYLDLVDLKTILETNWPLFETDCAAVGWGGGKRQALAWFNELNTIRRNVMHPVRRHFIPNLVDDAMIPKLTALYKQVQRLRVRSTGSRN